MAEDRVEELLAQYLSRRLDGASESPADFAARHPEHADVLARRLARLELFDFAGSDTGTASFEVPTSFDGFEIVRELGRGGMGVVYEARQLALNRRVAIKVIAGGGALSPQVRSRFEREITTLARISHPSIVKVFGSGTVGGAPYVVMELVDGEPLTKRLPAGGERIARASIEPLVRIAIAIARALDYAHEQGVVHRDVKPGNVLITRNGDPVLLDFGLARDVDRESMTGSGVFVGTLSYTAPEQARGERVDRRADVYGLGATLYHLLTGSPPYDARSITDLVRKMEFGAPSSASRINPTLPRDLVTVLEHAIAPDPLQRYASCADFADDLARFCDGVPVHARAPSARVALGYFARRHRALVASAATGLLVLILGLVATAWQARRATREAAFSRELNDFYRTLLAAPDPGQAGPNVTLLELLPTFVERARTELAARPEHAATVLATLGQTYLTLDELERGENLIRESLEIRERVLGRQHPATLESKAFLALALDLSDRSSDAEPLYREVWTCLELAGDKRDRNVLIYRHNFASCLLNLHRDEEGLRLLRETLDLQRARFGPDDADVLTSLNTLSKWQQEHGQTKEARETLEQLLTARRTISGPRHPDTLVVESNLAATLTQLGERQRAIELLQDVVEVRLEDLGEDHAKTFVSMMNLGAVCNQDQQRERADQWLTRAFEGLERVNGPTDEDTLGAMSNLARNCFELGQLERAKTLCNDLLARASQIGAADDDPLVKRTRDLLAKLPP